MVPPFACCVRCGGYATTHARGLRQECPGAPRGGAGRTALKRIAVGLHPRGHAKVTNLWALCTARRLAVGNAPLRQTVQYGASAVEHTRGIAITTSHSTLGVRPADGVSQSAVKRVTGEAPSGSAGNQGESCCGEAERPPAADDGNTREGAGRPLTFSQHCKAVADFELSTLALRGERRSDAARRVQRDHSPRAQDGGKPKVARTNLAQR